MNDLISKSEVLELLYKIFDKYYMSTDKNPSIISNSFGTESFGIDVFKEIKKMPTAYDIDKVVEEIKTLKEEALGEYNMGEYNLDNNIGNSISENYRKDMNEGKCFAYDEAIEIVKQGGVSNASDYVCEWRIVDRPHNLPIYNTSCGKIRLQYTTGVDIYCNGCGNKIKVKQNDN